MSENVAGDNNNNKNKRLALGRRGAGFRPPVSATGSTVTDAKEKRRSILRLPMIAGPSRAPSGLGTQEEDVENGNGNHNRSGDALEEREKEQDKSAGFWTTRNKLTLGLFLVPFTIAVICLLVFSLTGDDDEARPPYFSQDVYAEFDVLESCASYRLPDCSLTPTEVPYKGLEWDDNGTPYFRDSARYIQYELDDGNWEVRLDIVFGHDPLSSRRMHSILMKMPRSGDQVLAFAQFDSFDGVEYHDCKIDRSDAVPMSYYVEQFLRKPLQVAPTGGNASSPEEEDAISEDVLDGEEAVVSVGNESDRTVARDKAATTIGIGEENPSNYRIAEWLMEEFDASTEDMKVAVETSGEPSFFIDSEALSMDSPRAIDGLSPYDLAKNSKTRKFEQKYRPMCFSYENGGAEVTNDFVTSEPGRMFAQTCNRTGTDDESYCAHLFLSLNVTRGSNIHEECVAYDKARLIKCRCSCARGIWDYSDKNAEDPDLNSDGSDFQQLAAFRLEPNRSTFLSAISKCHEHQMQVANERDVDRAVKNGLGRDPLWLQLYDSNGTKLASQKLESGPGSSFWVSTLR